MSDKAKGKQHAQDPMNSSLDEPSLLPFTNTSSNSFPLFVSEEKKKAII